MKYNYNSVEVSHIEEDNYVHIRFLGVSTSEELKNAYNQALELVKEHNVRLWLIDQRKQMIHPDDQKWVEQEWFPSSLEHAPLDPNYPRCVAVVQSENFFVEFSANKFAKENSAPGFSIEVFRNPENAQSWIKEKSLEYRAS